MTAPEPSQEDWVCALCSKPCPQPDGCYVHSTDQPLQVLWVHLFCAGLVEMPHYHLAEIVAAAGEQRGANICIGMHFAIAPSECCSCHKVLTGAAGMESPAPGSLMVCTNCAAVHALDETLKPVAASDEQRLSVVTTPTYLALLDELRRKGREV